MSKQTKKGVELSLNMIIIAVVLLLILVVVSFLLFRGSNNFQSGITACTGTCAIDASYCDEEGFDLAIPMKCKNPQGTGPTGGASADDTGNFCCRNTQ